MPDGFKRGRMIVKNQLYEIKDNWVTIDAIDILKDRIKFTNLIPTYNYER